MITPDAPERQPPVITKYQTSRGSRALLLDVIAWLNLKEKDPERWQGLETLIAAAIKQGECRVQNNQVACVSCHQPVQVTALNAIRCDDCGPTPLQERAVKQAEARGLREAADLVKTRLAHYKKTMDVGSFTRRIQINEAEGCLEAILATAQERER